MNDSRSDAELVTSYLDGAPDALAAIYDRYADSLHDTAAVMTRSRHDAADLTQDVFVRAAERLGQLRDRSRLKPWLFAVLRNEVYRRRAARAAAARSTSRLHLLVARRWSTWPPRLTPPPRAAP